MRLIGHLQSESVARTFSDYLYVQGIKSQIEALYRHFQSLPRTDRRN